MAWEQLLTRRKLATLAAAATLCTTAVPSLKDSLQAETVASLVVMMILAALAVILRLVSRKISAAKFGIDDALIIVALVNILPTFRIYKLLTLGEKAFLVGSEH
jgi:hypothetical protein